MIKLSRVLITLLFLVSNYTVLANENEFVIDDYEFEWIISEQYGFKTSIVKTEDSIKVIVREKDGISNSIYLSYEEIPIIIELLDQTEKFYKSQKGSLEDISNEIKKGEYKAVFVTSPKSGFFISIRGKRSFSSGFTLQRKSARSLKEVLSNIQPKMKFLEKEIDY